MIDKKGFRYGVAIILINEDNRIFWAKRIGNTGWQFPQGGMQEDETPREAMFRELYEEIGVTSDDVDIVAESRRWLYYYLPKKFIRHHSKPLCIGQRQKWFLLKTKRPDVSFTFDTSDKPEFDGFRWIDYWQPLKDVVYFKRKLYRRALREFSSFIFPPDKRRRGGLLRRKSKDQRCESHNTPSSEASISNNDKKDG
jgi:putative (di)nucleoside polyphosphate hydrolase